MDDLLLSVKNLNVVLNDHLVLDDLSFDLKKGDSLAIIGPNGAGKSVLLRALLGFLPFEGKVNWKKGIKIGYVPQRLSVDKDMPLTTYEFFSLKEGNREKILNSLSSVGFDVKNDSSNFIKHVFTNRLGALSGGELQRVLIAWALIDSPSVLLFDEPTSGVDISSEETIYHLLHSLQEKHRLTMVLISHELQVVYKYASTVMCLNKEKVCFGPPLEVLDRETLQTLYGKDVGFYKHSHTQKL